MDSGPLYRLHELSFRTQYAELKERARSAGALLAGTPGTLVKRSGTGYVYWYRAYRSAGGAQVEDLVCKDGDADALDQARARIEFTRWTAQQVRDLRLLGFQVADKAVARVMVALHNAGLLDAGLVLVGTLGWMAWLNELGARTVAARTQDIDLAARQGLKLAAPQSFLQTVQATKLGFEPVPGLPNRAPSTSVKLAGRDGLRIDVLAPGKALGRTVALPPLQWHAQTVPHFDYLLQQPVEAALLAGGHCVPVWLPQAPRLMWHKLYASAVRRSFPEKAQKDLLQAATLAALCFEQFDQEPAETFGDVPAAMRPALKRRLPALRRVLGGHPAVLEQFEQVLGAA